MDMTPESTEPALGVWFLALEVEGDDDFRAGADEGVGIVLGLVTVLNGAPVLHTPRELVAEAADA